MGIFGGTFDPPHVGHLVAASDVRHALGLDVMLLVVANEPWQKVGERPISPAQDRFDMVGAAVRRVHGLEASDIELRRGGPSYTVDTCAELHEMHPQAELFVVLGADAAAGLGTWERAEGIAELAYLVVVDRDGVPSPPVPSGWPHRRVAVPRLDVTSTDVRRRMAEGRPVEFLVPQATADIARRRGLYGGMS